MDMGIYLAYDPKPNAKLGLKNQQSEKNLKIYEKMC
jgi:hypothetical protein